MCFRSLHWQLTLDQSPSLLSQPTSINRDPTTFYGTFFLFSERHSSKLYGLEAFFVGERMDVLNKEYALAISVSDTLFSKRSWLIARWITWCIPWCIIWDKNMFCWNLLNLFDDCSNYSMMICFEYKTMVVVYCGSWSNGPRKVTAEFATFGTKFAKI